MELLPLDLYGEVTTADGATFKWDANQPADSRPQNLSFRTKIGEGFSDAGLQLARRIDQDYPDLELVNDVTLTGADGSIAYEGRLSAMPRDLGDRHSIGVTLAGWMAHAKDRKFREIYVDRDLRNWAGVPIRRRASLLGSWGAVYDASQQNDPDAASQAIVNTSWTGAWAIALPPIAEAWYDAGPELTITQINYDWAILTSQTNPADAGFFWAVAVSIDDAGSSVEPTADLSTGVSATGQTFSPTNRFRYGLLETRYNTGPAGSDGATYGIKWSNLGVYCTALPLYTGQTGQPPGVLASDVMRDIAARFCPLLDTSGVQDTDYVIQQCAFRDRAFPYDAWLELNKFHLWHLAVWEGKRLTFEPYDLTDYDWEIRTDDPGTTFSPQGPSTEDLFNGIAVTYTDLLTGIVNTITPDTNAELGDSSTTNPWNKAGIAHWDEITLTTPALLETAVSLGVAALADRNRARTPGTITARGYISDRAGNLQPCWKVRAGDTIAITNFNDAVRLIVETDYDDEQKLIRLAIDKPFALLDAYLDRQSNALQAAGLA